MNPLKMWQSSNIWSGTNTSKLHCEEVKGGSYRVCAECLLPSIRSLFVFQFTFSKQNYEMRRIILSVVVSCGSETKSVILKKEHISSILNWFTITVYLTCIYSNIMGVSGTRILLRRVSVLQDHRWGLYIDISFGAFAKLWKMSISFVMSVRLEQLGSHWMDFNEIWYLSIFRKSVAKIQVLLKSEKNNE